MQDPDDSPILVVPYMWIGDFVRCHSVVKLLRTRFPNRPVDVLATTLCAPLADYMPGVRQAIIADLPRGRLALAKQAAVAERLKREGYGTALVMPSTWKSTLAPFLAGIPERIGWVGEVRFVLLNDARWGRRKLPRMVDQCAALALPRGAKLPAEWPKPELKVPADEIAAWRRKHGLTAQPAVALAPGAVGPAKRWTAAGYAALARRLLADGFAVWVLGGPGEKAAAQEIVGDTQARDLTGHRPARGHSGAGGRDSGGVQRFRPSARRGGRRHAHRRNIRADQPVALGAAQSAGGHDSSEERTARAGRATNRSAASAIIAAWSKSRRTTFIWPQAARWRRWPRGPMNPQTRHNAVFIKSV